MANIKKIKLSDGTVYNIVDAGALKVDEQGRILTPNATLNQIIISKHLEIVEIDGVPIEQDIDTLLTLKYNTITGAYTVKKRDTKYILEDIGGQVQVDSDKNILELKVGRGDYDREDY